MSTKKSTASKSRTPRGRSTAADVAEIAAIKFDGLPCNLQAFNSEWDHGRGMQARVAACLLEWNDEQLAAKMSESGEAAYTFLDMQDGLAKEVEYLKIHIAMLEKAATRILCVAHRMPPHIRDAKRAEGAA